jgi:hypothetical protein
LEETGAKSSATWSSKMPPVARKPAAMADATYGHAFFSCAMFTIGLEVERGSGDDLGSSSVIRTAERGAKWAGERTAGRLKAAAGTRNAAARSRERDMVSGDGTMAGAANYE